MYLSTFEAPFRTLIQHGQDHFGFEEGCCLYELPTCHALMACLRIAVRGTSPGTGLHSSKRSQHVKLHLPVVEWSRRKKSFLQKRRRRAGPV